jgi:hypothetical protein
MEKEMGREQKVMETENPKMRWVGIQARGHTRGENK